jgi:hypothetical protein
MSKRLARKQQQEVVSEFVEEKNLESCMYVYLAAFLDIHQREHPHNETTYERAGIRALLEVSFEMIRFRLSAHGLMNTKDAGHYMLNRKK